jgi:hypothetical protein
MKIAAKQLGLKAGFVLCMLAVLLAGGCCVFGGGDRGGGGHDEGSEGHSQGREVKRNR